MFDKGNAMLVWMLQPVAETEDEWNEWYDLEHVPGLLQVPGFITGNRFRLTATAGLGGKPPAPVPDYLSYYELFNDGVLESETYVARRLSLVPGMRPRWTQRMLGAITRAYGGVYVPVGDTHFANPEIYSDRVDNLAILSFASPANSLWLDSVVGPALSAAPAVLAHRSLSLLRGSPPIEGMRERAETSRRLIFCAIDGDAGLESLGPQLHFPGGTGCTIALYERWL